MKDSPNIADITKELLSASKRSFDDQADSGFDFKILEPTRIFVETSSRGLFGNKYFTIATSVTFLIAVVVSGVFATRFFFNGSGATLDQERAALEAQSQGEVLADSSLSGKDLILDSDVTIKGTLTAKGLNITGNSSLNVTNNANLDQDLTKASSPTFASINFSSLTEQIFSGDFVLTIDASGSIVTTNGSQTLTNKTISGGSNTLSGIGNSSLANSKVTINTSGLLSGGGDVDLGDSIDLSASLPNTATFSGVLGVGGEASFSGKIVLDSQTAQINATRNRPLQFGFQNTGAIQFLNANNYVDANGNLYLAGSLIASGGVSGLVGAWTDVAGIIAPATTTDDFAIGGSATSSAKFFVSGTSGRVGIGSTAPAYPLDVVGTVQITGSGFTGLRLPTGASANYMLTTDGSGNASWTNPAGSGSFGAWTLSGSTVYPNVSSYNVLLGSTSVLDDIAKLRVLGSSGTLNVASISGSTSKAALAVDNTVGDLFTASSSGLSRFVITQSGNVGVGTSNPTANLQIGSGAGVKTISINNFSGGDASGYTYWQWDPGYPRSNLYSSNRNFITGDWGVYLVAGGTTAHFGTGGEDYIDISIGGGERLRMTNTGNIGINTSAPGSLLEVRGFSGTNTYSGIASVASISGKTSFATMVVDNQGVGDLFTASSSGLSRFVITQNGNVGIGSSAPVDRLDVNGGIRANYIQQNLRGSIITGLDGQNVSFANGNITVNTISGRGLTVQMWTGNIGIGTSSPIATFDLRAASGISPIASISGATAFAGLVVDNSGVGDLFTASSSGLSRFVVTQNGNVGIGTVTPGYSLEAKATSYGAEKVTNGSFTGSATGWTVGSWLYNNNAIDSNGAWGYLQQDVSAVAGELYKVTYTVSNYSSGSLVVYVGGATGTAARSANGTYTDYIKAVSTGNLLLYPTGGTMTVDDVSVVKVVGGIIASEGGAVLTGTVTALAGGYAYPGYGFTGAPYGIGMFKGGDSSLGLSLGNCGTCSLSLYGHTGSSWYTFGTDTVQETFTSAHNINFKAYANSSRPAFQFNSPSAITATSGNQFLVGIGVYYTGSATFAPTSGTATFTAFDVSPTINQTGGASGLSRGIYINPTLTSAADFRAIETTDGRTILKSTLGTVPTASISAQSSFAGLLVDNTVGDLFTASSSGLSRFVITQNGNVGIGTSSPGYSTEISGRSTGSNLLRVGQAKVGDWYTGSYAMFVNQALTGNSDFALVQNSGGATYLNSASGNSINFGIGANYYMALGSSGNLGIGTTSPSSLVNVVHTGTTTNGGVFTGNGLSTGNLLSLTSTSIAQTTGKLLNIDFSPGGATTYTGNLVNINVGAMATISGQIFNIQNNGSDIFSVNQAQINANLPINFTSPGDVGIAYDLGFTNPVSSYITSNAPLYITAGKIYNSSNLVLSTYNAGNVIVDSQAFVANYAATVSGQLLVGTSSATPNVGNFYLTNSQTFGKALAILNQNEGADVLTASVSGSTKFVVTNAGNVGIGYSNLTGALGVSGNTGLGTSAPLFKLHVADSQAATAAAMVNNTNTGADADGLVVKLGFTGVGSTTNSFVTFLDGNGAINGLIRSTGANGVAYQTSGIADFAEYMPVSSRLSVHSSQLEAGTVVCQEEDGIIPCNFQFSILNSQSNSDDQFSNNSNIIGIVSAHPNFLGGTKTDHSVAVGFVGQVPVKISSTSATIRPGDILVPDPNQPGFAMKAIKSSYAVGKALGAWTGESETVLAYLNVGYAVIDNSQFSISNFQSNPNDPINKFQNMATLSAELATISDTLKVIGHTDLGNTTIGGTLDVGVLHFDDLLGEISAMTGKVKINSDLEVTGKILGNDSVRGEINLLAGDDATSSAQSWTIVPKSLVLTPTWNARVWISKLTKDGFTVNVDPAPIKDEKVFWQAMW